MNRQNIQKGLLFAGITVGVLISFIVLVEPETLKNAKALALSIGAYLSIFARQFISEKISDVLGLDDNSKDIEELKKTDDEIMEELRKTNSDGREIRAKLTETQKRLDDTQDFADELLDKLNNIVDQLEREDIREIETTIESIERKHE